MANFREKRIHYVVQEMLGNKGHYQNKLTLLNVVIRICVVRLGWWLFIDEIKNFLSWAIIRSNFQETTNSTK